MKPISAELTEIAHKYCCNWRFGQLGPPCSTPGKKQLSLAQKMTLEAFHKSCCEWKHHEDDEHRCSRPLEPDDDWYDQTIEDENARFFQIDE